MSLRLKLILILLAFLLAAMSNAVMMFLLERAADEKQAWMTRTYQAIEAGQRLFSALQDAETGQRGYLLTRETPYLAPYYRGVEAVDHWLAQLARKADPQVLDEALLAELKRQIQLKLEELGQTIKLTEAGQYDKALEIVRQDIGKRYMERVRHMIETLEQRHHLALAERRSEYSQVRTRIIMVIAFEAALFLGLIIFALMFLRRNLMKPIEILLAIVRETKHNRKVSVQSVVPEDEMGYLIASVYEMNHAVVERSQQLAYRAQRDGLTGLFNRAAMEEMVPQALAKAQENNMRMALIYMDLDKFKPINDTLGHEAGDAVLKEVSQRLRQLIRAQDAAFRLGGDEFLLILAFREYDELQRILARLCEHLNGTIKLGSHTVEIGASLGVAVFPDDATALELLLQQADQAMYAAKQAGRCYEMAQMH